MGKNKTRIIRLLAVAAACVLETAAAGGSYITFASQDVSDIQSEIKRIQEENQERRDKIDNLGEDIENNEDAMKLISDQIDGVNYEIEKYRELLKAKEKDIDGKFAEIDAIEKSIRDKEDEIEKKKSDIAELKEENEKNLEQFAKLARALYMRDTSDTLPVLNGSSDWYNYFVYSDVVKNISRQNFDFAERLSESITKQEELIDDLNSDISSLQAEKKDLTEQKAEFLKQKDALESEKVELEGAAAEKQSYLYGLASENEDLQNKITDLKTDIAEGNAALEALNKQLEEQIRAAQQSSGSDQLTYDGEMIWPLDVGFRYISTPFGYDAEFDRMHHGIDVGDAGIEGANIYAAQSGTVITVVNYCTHNIGASWSCGCGGGYGNYIVIDHGGGISTLYAHCGTVNVYEGEEVNAGDVIGTVGSTGWSTGFHLHFEVRESGIAVDPYSYL